MTTRLQERQEMEYAELCEQMDYDPNKLARRHDRRLITQAQYDAEYAKLRAQFTTDLATMNTAQGRTA